jgi:long-subunit acyl-CoA synthetase (AMP-forming)
MNPLMTALQNRAATDIVIRHGKDELTAECLVAQTYELCLKLQNAGVERLGVLCRNSAAWIIADLACLTGRICCFPMPAFFSDAQLRHSLVTAGINVILTDDPDRATEIAGGSVQDSDTESMPGLTLIRLVNERSAMLPAGTQKITFTSGSTGQPRGVCLSVENQLRVAQALASSLPCKTPQHLCLLPLSTLLENIGGVYYPLLASGSITTPPELAITTPNSVGPDIMRMLQAINRHRPTSMIMLPQMLVGLLAAMQDGWPIPSELEFVAVGGAKVSAALLKHARAQGLPVYEGYGLSETGSVACLNYSGNDRIGTVGRPLPHINTSIQSGEIIITGNTFLGYAGEPASWGKDSIATGDLGEFDESGFLHLQGRRKNLLISDMGRNISPEWVESEILQHPDISQCVIFGDARPFCSALIAASKDTLDNTRIQEVLDTVNDNLPDYARVLRWHRLARPLSLDDGLFTQNGRPNREHIARHFAQTIDALYGETTS